MNLYDDAKHQFIRHYGEDGTTIVKEEPVFGEQTIVVENRTRKAFYRITPNNELEILKVINLKGDE